MKCRKCLVAALVAVLVLTGAVLLGITMSVLAAPGVPFRACSQATCKGLTEDMRKTLGASGDVMVQTENVKAAGSVHGCPECTVLIFATGQRMYVLGAMEDSACRIFGGDACKAK